MIARACSKSSTVPSAAALCRRTRRYPVTETKPIQSAGIRDLLPSGQDQDEIQHPFAIYRVENLKQSSLKRMTRTNDRDSLRKVLTMGSVS